MLSKTAMYMYYVLGVRNVVPHVQWIHTMMFIFLVMISILLVDTM